MLFFLFYSLPGRSPSRRTGQPNIVGGLYYGLARSGLLPWRIQRTYKG
jgi:hypothetical protein